MILTRRRLAALALAGAAASALPRPALALTAAEATALVEALVRDINAIIASGKSESAMIADFRTIFATYANLPGIARYVLGSDARALSNQQVNDFTTAFSAYISSKYGRRFREFIGGRLEVSGTRSTQIGIEVVTVAYLRGEAPFEVTFTINDQGGRPLFVNMSIEGVNMLLSERQEVQAMLDARGRDIARLTADLRAY